MRNMAPMDKNLKPTLADLDGGGRHYKNISVKYYWRGGANGAETDWNEPMNWYNRHVPGWYDEVVISGEHTCLANFPIIEVFANDIAQLIIEDGGKLFIGEGGRLSVDGLGRKGLGVLNEGELFVQGELTVQRTTFASVRNKGLIYNTGSLAIDKTDKRGIVQVHCGHFVNLGELLYL